MKKSFVSLLCLGTLCSVFAGGFRVSLQGVKEAAQAHTGTASTKDASATFFNPAGLALQEKKWSISVNGFALKGTAGYKNTDYGITYETDNGIGTPFALYASHKFNDKIAIGLGVYTPYGNTVDWGKDWSGRNLIQDIQLQSFFIQPTVSYRLTDWASIGAGLIYATGSVELNRAFLAAGDINLESTKADGMGYNLGLMLIPSKKVSIGLNYRSKVKMEAEGDATVISTQGINLIKDTWEATLPLAAEFTFGISYRPIPKLILNYDMNYTRWDAYESLDFDFSGNTLLPDSSSTRDYSNTFTYRLGAAYNFTEAFVGRIGAYYDESPSPDEYFSPETPTLNNTAVTGGLGYTLKNGLGFDLTYMYLNGKERSFHNIETNFAGDATNRVHILGFGASYNF